MNEIIKAFNQRIREELSRYDSRFIAIINNNCVKILEEREQEAHKNGTWDVDKK